MLLGLLLGALLNAESLWRAAEGRPFEDPARGRHVAVWGGLRQISHALFLDRPRRLIENLSGAEPRPGVDVWEDERGWGQRGGRRGAETRIG